MCVQLFTELPMDQIEELSKLQGADINQAKVILANEATKYVHQPRPTPAPFHKTRSVALIACSAGLI